MCFCGETDQSKMFSTAGLRDGGGGRPCDDEADKVEPHLADVVLARADGGAAAAGGDAAAVEVGAVLVGGTAAVHGHCVVEIVSKLFF